MNRFYGQQFKDTFPSRITGITYNEHIPFNLKIDFNCFFMMGTGSISARSRVLEYLNQVQGSLPETAKSAIGPDATGVGWI